MCNVLNTYSIGTHWGGVAGITSDVLDSLAKKPQPIPQKIAERFYRIDDLLNAIQFSLGKADSPIKILRQTSIDEADYLAHKAKQASSGRYEPKFSQDELKDRLKKYQAFMKELDKRREATQDDVPMLKECSTFLRNLEHALYNA